MKSLFILLILLTVAHPEDVTEHEYSSIRWVRLDTVKLQGHFLGSLPNLFGQDEKGTTHNLLAVQQAEPWKVLIISYMAEWCGNCRYDAPVVREIYQQYHPLGLNQIIVMEYSTMKGARAFIKQYQLEMPVYYGQVRGKWEDQKNLSQHYALRRALADGREWGTPFHIIIERGNHETIGYLAGEFNREELETYLKEKMLSAVR